MNHSVRVLNLWSLALVLLCATTSALSKEPPNVIALTLTATAEHPRNSEGAFATLKSGRVLFCYSQFYGGTSDFSPCRIAQIVSDDQGRSWSEPKVMFVPEPGSMEMSVSLLRLASGKLALFSAIKHGTLDCRPYMRISEDDGATWSAARCLISEPAYFVLNNDRVIQTSSGRIIMPLAFHPPLSSDSEAEWRIDLRAVDHWYYSDDEGATWSQSPTRWSLPGETKTGLQEPGVVQVADGSILSWARTDRGSQFGFRSRDDGQTWSSPAALQLRSPAAPASIKRVPKSDDLLAVFNDYSGQFPFVLKRSTYSGRTPLVASISSDDGATWQARRMLESDPQRDYCYTAIHFTEDAVLLAYMANGAVPEIESQLCIRRIDLRWLCAPDDLLTTKAKGILREVFEQEEGWVRIHAAEALVASGDAIAVRQAFQRLQPTIDLHPSRVGVWRVLANTSPTILERTACITAIKKIYLDPQAPDRAQALETLCKLRAGLDPAVLEQAREAMSAASSDADRALPAWALCIADESGALDRLTGLLKSSDETARLAAAYALRWLGKSDRAAVNAVVHAANAESPGTRAYPYLISAAATLDADPSRLKIWRDALSNVLATGTVEARFEVSHSLREQATESDLPMYESLLDGPGNDTRIGAALTIVTVKLKS